MAPLNLGNLNRRLRLWCRHCGDTWPEDTVLEAIQLHHQVEHDVSDIKLDLLPQCRCGAAMAVTRASAQAGREITDFFGCPACGAGGYTTRKASA